MQRLSAILSVVVLLVVADLQTACDRPRERWVEKKREVTNGVVKLNIRDSQQFLVDVQPEMMPASLSIEFTASGVLPLSDNDVQVGIGDRSSIANFVNENQASLLWSTHGRSTTDHAVVDFVKSGEYYLAVSNHFSWIFPKQVNLKATLTYHKLERVN